MAWDGTIDNELDHLLNTEVKRSPAQEDLATLELQLEEKKNLPVGRLLAELGWVPPSTAAAMRDQIGELHRIKRVLRDLLN